MSVEMKSQGSDNESDYGQDSEDMDDDMYGGYYDSDGGDALMDQPKETDDPEYFNYKLLLIEDVERLLNENVEAVCNCIKVRLGNRLVM